MMDQSARVRYHIAAAEFFTGDFSQIAQDVLFTIAHHYHPAVPMLEQQIKDNVADEAQIQQIVSVYYEAAKVMTHPSISCLRVTDNLSRELKHPLLWKLRASSWKTQRGCYQASSSRPSQSLLNQTYRIQHIFSQLTSCSYVRSVRLVVAIWTPRAASYNTP